MLAPLALLLLLSPTITLASPSGSLEALLDRVSHHKRAGSTVLGTGTRIGMRGTGAIEQEMMRKQKAKREEMEKREIMGADESGDGQRMKKMSKNKRGAANGKVKGKKVGKRWVWATEIIQDSTPTSGLPDPGVNADLLTPSIDVSTPTVSIPSDVVPTASPVNASPVNASSVLNTTLIVNGALLSGSLLSNGTIDLTLSNGTIVSLVNETIAVNGTSYVLTSSSDDPALDSVQPDGEGAVVEVSSTNGVQGEASIELSDQDVVSIDDPSLPDGAAPAVAESLVLKRQLSHQSHPRHGKRAFEGGLVKGHQVVKPRHKDGEGREMKIRELKMRDEGERKKHEKRWVWTSEIIQDDTPSSGLPPVGSNANLLSSSYPVATPAVVTPPALHLASPLASSSTTATPPPSTTSHKMSKAEQKMHDRLGHKRDTEEQDGEAEIEEREVEDNSEEKRWVRDTVVIQDGDTAPAQPATPTVDLGNNPFPYPASSSPASPVPAAASTSHVVVNKEAEMESRRAARKAALAAGKAQKRSNMMVMHRKRSFME